jgi:hypothetical protein
MQLSKDPDFTLEGKKKNWAVKAGWQLITARNVWNYQHD